MLKIVKLRSGYGTTTILNDISMKVEEGQIVSVIGSNGVGKSTLMKTIMGMADYEKGHIEFLGKNIEGKKTYDVLKEGIVMVPEGKHIFPRISVYDNLRAGAYLRKNKAEFKEDVRRMYELFPILEERKNQLAGTFSGGQQQMLAIARALMGHPRLLILDEPSLGLSPLITQQILEIIKQLRDNGMTILLVEQNVRASLRISDYAYVISRGTVLMEGTGKELEHSDLVRKAYLGM